MLAINNHKIIVPVSSIFITKAYRLEKRISILHTWIHQHSYIYFHPTVSETDSLVKDHFSAQTGLKYQHAMDDSTVQKSNN